MKEEDVCTDDGGANGGDVEPYSTSSSKSHLYTGRKMLNSLKSGKIQNVYTDIHLHTYFICFHTISTLVAKHSN